MRYLANTMLLLDAALISVGKQNPQQAKQQESKTKNQTAQPKQTVAPPKIHESTPTSAPTPQTKEQTAQPELNPFLSHGEWVTGSLTAFYVLISYFSFRAIKRQANIPQQAATATRNAATAAERNTEALSSIERPWLLVTGVSYTVLPTRTPSGEFQNTSHVPV